MSSSTGMLPMASYTTRTTHPARARADSASTNRRPTASEPNQ